MTFEELVLEVSRNAFPEGEARNLRPLHTNMLRDGLIDLQKKVQCLQVNHIDHFNHQNTFFFCGSSAIDAPTGFIQSVRVIPDLLGTTNWRQCDAIFCQPESRQEFECRIQNAVNCGENLGGCPCGYPIDFPYGYYYANGQYYEYPALDYGMLYPDSTTDNTYRAQERWCAMFNGFIYTYPVINSDELIIVEWNGIKRNWEDSDEFPYANESGEADRQIIQALEFYVMSEHAMRIDCDLEKSQLLRGRYDQLVSELIWQCRKEGLIPPRKHCFVDCNC